MTKSMPWGFTCHLPKKKCQLVISRHLYMIEKMFKVFAQYLPGFVQEAE